MVKQKKTKTAKTNLFEDDFCVIINALWILLTAFKSTNHSITTWDPYDFIWCCMSFKCDFCLPCVK